MISNINQKVDLKGFALQSPLVEKMLVKLETIPAVGTLKFEVQNITENSVPPSFEISATPKALL